ncbi:7831_t:CDS:2 [Funneliformis caledonium]|uniref:7831_t:CDS:1 n=1 Tax=Funneliformis caledonium TaxID=1117310 RepID=A0A9N9C5V3_9GLOM|nr:7831_t:CDS:2 [Funneliformis caledonium]
MKTSKPTSFPSVSTTDFTENTHTDSITNDSVVSSTNINFNKKVASEESRKDLTHYVNIINQFLRTSSVLIEGENGDTRLQFAIQHLYEGLEFYPDAYELKDENICCDNFYEENNSFIIKVA